MRYALVSPTDVIDRFASNIDPNVETKSGWRWLICNPTSPPTHDTKTEKITGPTYTVGISSVTESWNKVSLTAQEISDAKDAAVSSLNGSDYKVLLQTLLTVVNDIRATKAKLNALIDATGQSGTVTKFPAGQVAQVDLTQLKTAIKAAL